MERFPGTVPGGAHVDDDELEIEKRWMGRARLNPADFNRFYEKYADRVFSFCLSRTLDRDLAEDLTSETFTQAQATLWRFQWKGVTYGAYLYKIALNLVRQHARKTARAIHLNEADVTIIDTRLNPLAEIVLTERQFLVRKAVAGMDSLGQDIFLLHYWENMTTAEIAAVLGTPEGTVKTRLQRGRHHLRSRLRDLGVAGPNDEEAGPLRSPENRGEDEG